MANIDIKFYANIAGEKPTQPVQSDWTESDSGKLSFIKNKPHIITNTEISTLINEKADKTTVDEKNNLQDAEIAKKQNKSDAVGNKTAKGGEIFNIYDGEPANQANGFASSAFGRRNKVNAALSFAEGESNSIEGEYSHAEGTNNKVFNSASRGHIEGTENIISNNYEHAQGRFNKSNKGTLDSIGIGYTNRERQNATETLINGKNYIYGIGEYDGTNSVEPNAQGVVAKDVATVINGIRDEIGVLDAKTTELLGE